ncbi:coiled-coil domain-containing protein 69 [Gracilinanus agilis]|uniref:coiled-coil domain-containing protein 69 n=1 Tax=Gracilinanus agilis TaxID=191870 RepID=UPI001CFCA2AE|nr:coiled-coil domain-containing protein 69 [Gracilinanus agilis]
MGGRGSKLNCYKSPNKRHQEEGQLPRPEPIELGPLQESKDPNTHLFHDEQQQLDMVHILQKHQEESEKLRPEHQFREVEIQVVDEQELELREKLAEQLQVLQREHEETLQALQVSHEKEKMTLMEAFQAAKAALQETIEGLTSQMEVFQTKIKRVEESILSRDYKKHIQDYGSPSQFWEQELESLHFVIEMKNERIHELDRRLIQMEIEKEKNLSLEEKITMLQQENEDLRVQGQNHQRVSRQLSEDLFLVREALEKESQLRQQIQQEKEELLYRLVTSDSPAAFQLTSSKVSYLAT